MTMSTADVQAQALLSAYDDQMRGAPPHPPTGVTYEQDGPLLRIVGQFRGFVGATGRRATSTCGGTSSTC